MVLIIGAGLSGLLIAYRLKQAGIPFKIVEARPRVGGRINTVLLSENTPVEMGATWFNTEHKALISLLNELKIEYFEQFMEGNAIFQAQANTKAELFQMPKQSASYRIKDGTSNLINALFKKLNQSDLLLNQQVEKILIQEKSVRVFTKEIFECSTVVLALPPKIWANTILVEPKLPQNLLQIAKETHTWMEDSIKVAVSYKKPFWTENYLSGTFFSNAGPVTEFYDHSDFVRENYALCGFVSPYFKNVSLTERRTQIISQLTQVFGNEAKFYTNYEECVWSNELYTFTKS